VDRHEFWEGLAWLARVGDAKAGCISGEKRPGVRPRAGPRSNSTTPAIGCVAGCHDEMSRRGRPAGSAPAIRNRAKPSWDAIWLSCAPRGRAASPGRRPWLWPLPHQNALMRQRGGHSPSSPSLGPLPAHPSPSQHLRIACVCMCSVCLLYAA